jgi:hypothetical protein
MLASYHLTEISELNLPCTQLSVGCLIHLLWVDRTAKAQGLPYSA